MPAAAQPEPDTGPPAAATAGAPSTAAPVRVRQGGAADAVAGVVPDRAAEPTSADQVAEVLRAAAEGSLAVVPRGGGSKLDWGAPPRGCDLLVDLRGLDRIIEHAAGDMVVRVEAGVPLSRLAEAVAGAGQQLAIDVPGYDDGSTLAGTVGGALAVGIGGPRRLRYGRPRDLLLGITMVRADGVVASAGGKVVKNVAGYDLGKLLCGSYGTLGVIVAATLRLHPLPAATRYLTVSLPDPAAAAACCAALLGSQLAPSAVELCGPGTDSARSLGVVAAFEGTPAGVDARVGRAAELAAAAPGPVEVAVTISEQPPAWYGRLPGSPAGTLVEMTVPPAGLADALALIGVAARESGLAAPVRGFAAGAVVSVGLSPTASPDAVAAFVSSVRAGLVAHAGSAVVRHAPPAVRESVDLWGPVHPGTLALMRRVKDQFDPGHRLAPGRFVGGI